MKRLFLFFVLTLTISATQLSWASSAPKHRYTPTSQVDDKNPNAQDIDKKNADEVEAYSDTTSIDTSGSQVDVGVDDGDSRTHSIYSLDNYNDPFDFLGSIFGKGTLFFVMFILLIVGLLIVFAPLIVIFIIVRYLYRRHNDRVKLMEMAMEKGINVPESERPIDKQSNEYLVKRGVKNAFLGAGLVAMFSFWHWEFMVGIGALVFMYGLGQVVIGYLPILKNKNPNVTEDDSKNSSSLGDFVKNDI